MKTLRYSDGNFPLDLPNYTQLLCCYDPHHHALWLYLNSKPRPCFTQTLLTEIRDFQQRVASHLQSSPEATNDIRYMVSASAVPGVFNLGGDIELFAHLAANRDRDTLYDYGRTCVDAIYHNAINLDIPSLTTISLVQGSALGGGLEAAMSSNVLIAEHSSQMGFPEIMFNLFPGMGAMSLLTRKIEPARAERLIQSGALHPAHALYDRGVVDEIAPDGEGVRAVNDFIRRHQRFANGYRAIRQARQRVCPLSYEELIDVVAIWVEAAMHLTRRDLRVMARITSAQYRLDKGTPSDLTAPLLNYDESNRTSAQA